MCGPDVQGGQMALDLAPGLQKVVSHHVGTGTPTQHPGGATSTLSF